MTLHQLTDSAKANITQLFILLGDCGTNERSHVLYQHALKVKLSQLANTQEAKLIPQRRDTTPQTTPIKKRSQ